MGPRVVSLVSRKRFGSSSRNHILPPLHNSEGRRNSRLSRATVPTGGHKRSHSEAGTPLGTPTRSHGGHHGRGHHGGHHGHPGTVVVTPTHHTRHKPATRQVNKIETVRILRARPAFYPMVRDRYAGVAAPVVDTGAHVLNSPGHGRRGVFAAAAAAAASGGHRSRNGSHLAAVTPTNYVLEISPEDTPRKPETRNHLRAKPDVSGGLKRKRRSAKQGGVVVGLNTSQGTLNL